MLVVFARYRPFRIYIEKREFPIFSGFPVFRPPFFQKTMSQCKQTYSQNQNYITFLEMYWKLGAHFLSSQKKHLKIENFENAHKIWNYFCVQGHITLSNLIFWNWLLTCISTNMFSYVFHWDIMTFQKIWSYRGFPMKPLHRQNREFPFF